MGGITTDIINYIDETTISGMLFALYLGILVLMAFIAGNSISGKKDIYRAGDAEDSLKNFRNSVIFPGIVMFLGLYFALPIVDKLGLHVVDRVVRPRYTWILMTTAVIALAMAFFIKKINGNARKLLAGIALCILIFCVGEHKVTSYVFKKPENLYKFPQSTVDITNKCLSEVEEPRIVVPVSSAYPFRQISTDIKLLYGDDAGYGRIEPVGGLIREVADQMETSEPDLYFITDVCRQYDCAYIVLDSIYMEFGGDNLNDYGYESSHTYIGDRTPIETESDGVDHSSELASVKIVDDGDYRYWDFSELGLEYEGTYGQYLLYRFVD